MNQIGSFKGVYLGYQPLHVEVAGPNRHKLSWGRRLREAGAGGSNPLTPTNQFNNLALAQAAACWSMNRFSLSPPETKKERRRRAVAGVAAAYVDVRV